MTDSGVIFQNWTPHTHGWWLIEQGKKNKVRVAKPVMYARDLWLASNDRRDREVIAHTHEASKAIEWIKGACSP